MYRRSALLTLLAVSLGCSKLLDLAKKDDAADAASAAVAASAAPAATDTAASTAAASASAVVAKAAAPAAHPSASAAGNKPLTASATTDRVPRNRDKDGPCPAGFVEQPGVENHSVCARTCKTEADCHGHTCEDSDVGSGKVCTDTASKKTAARSKCKPDEIEDGSDCLKPCTADKDCPKGGKKSGTCEQLKVPNPNGGVSTALVCR
jgi:hypothetical protein